MIKLFSLTSWRRVAQGSFLAVVLQLLAAGGAWAQSVCNVALVSVSSNQAVLKADCTATITGINWLRNGASMTGGVDMAISLLAGTDTFFAAPLNSGINTFTATGNAGTIPAGTSVTVVTPPSQTVTGVASGGHGTVTCASPVANGSTSTCTITTKSGYTLAGASSDTCGGSLSGNTYTTGPVTSACTVTVTFNVIPTYVVTSVASPIAGGSVVCTTPVNSGSTSTCAITTNSGYTLTGASSNTCGGPFSGSSFSTGPVTSACIVTATFSQNPTSFTVTGVASPPQGGTVTCNSPVNNNNATTCAVSANSGYTLTGASSDTCSGSLFANSISGTYTTGLVTSACIVTATFTQGSSSFAVNGVANPSAGGSVSCNPSLVTSGGTSACTITANAGYALTGASSSTCGGSIFGNTFNTGPVTSACTVTATFSNSTTGCGAGQVFNIAAGDIDWNPLTIIQIFPSYPLPASGTSGTAVRFVADAATYPNGIKMTMVDQSPALPPKIGVISACPHSFTPVGGNSVCAQSNISTFADFYLRFGPGTMWYDCPLTPGGTYYMNFAGQSGGNVSAQFSNSAR